jgi:hypothetical protein
LVGFVDGSHAAQCEFTLVLPQNLESIDELDWRSLLPEPERRGWVRIEEALMAIDTVGAD